MRLALALAFLLSLSGQPALAQQTEEVVNLKTEIEDLYEILPVSSGVVLKPLEEDSGIRAIEVTANAIALDGEILDPEELRDRLGTSRADLLSRLSALDKEQLASLLKGAATEADPRKEEPGPAADRRSGEDSAADRDRFEEPAPPDRPPRPERPRGRRRVGEKVVFGGQAHVRPHEVAENVVVIGGSANVEGDVNGDVVVVGGNAEVDGRVDGDVVVVGGRLGLGPHADVGGNVQSVGGRLDQHPEARVSGTVGEVAIPGLVFQNWNWASLGREMTRHRGPRFHPWRHFTKAFGHVIALVALGLILCLLVLVAPGWAQRLEQKVATEPWKSALVGILAQIVFLPLLVVTVVFLAITIIGIPLLILVPFAVIGLLIASLLGYACVAIRVGRLIGDRFGLQLSYPYVLLLVGLAAIEIWDLIGDLLDVNFGPLALMATLIGLFAFFVGYIAWTVGVGALVLTFLDSRFPPDAAAEAPIPGRLPPIPEPKPDAGSEPEAGSPPDRSGFPFDEDEPGAAPEEESPSVDEDEGGGKD